MSRTLGVLFLLVGLVLIVGGLGTAFYGDQKEKDEGERAPAPFLRDPEEQELNRAIVTGGLVAAGLGAAFVVVSVVLFVIGSARAEHALRKQMLKTQGQQQQVVLVSGAAGGADVVTSGPTEDRSGAGRDGLSTRTIGVIAVVAILVVAGAAFALLDDGDVADGAEGSDTRGYLDGTTWEGSLSAGVRDPVQGNSAPTTRTSRDFATPAATEEVRVTLSWRPEANGAERLHLSFVWLDEGQERLVAQRSGTSDITIYGLVPRGADVRVYVAQVEGDVVATQSFQVTASFYS